MTDLIDKVSQEIIAVCAEEMLPRFRSLDPSEVGSKHGGDVVTIVDTICENRLTAALTQLLPGSVTVGEEAVAADPSVLDRLDQDGDVWLIDPLDGTKNFAEHVPDFASMVALLRDGEVVGGWIYLPVSNRMAAAERGSGVLVDGEAPVWPPEKPLSEMIGRFNMPKGSARHRRLMPVQKAIRDRTSVGCAGSAYVDLTSGAIDFVMMNKLHPWDHAPGSLMVEEAGGVARLASGRRYTVAERQGPMIATHGEEQWQTLVDLLSSTDQPSRMDA